MMENYNNVEITVNNQLAAEWCYYGRIFKLDVPFEKSPGNISFEQRFNPTDVAYRLMEYIDEIRFCFIDGLL